MEKVNQDTSRLEVKIDTKSLKYVYFVLSEIKSFSEEFMEQLREVEFFNANEVGLERIDGTSLTKLSKMLIFWGGLNKIKRLEANVFSGNRNLRSIYLTFNKIHQVHDTAFEGLDLLYLLDLSSNKLKELTNFLNPLTNLLTLDLSSNLIERLPVNIFNNLENLMSLQLSNNNLLNLNPKSFDPLINLRHIIISFNKTPFKVINGTLFKINILLRDIVFIGDKIKAIDRKFIQNPKSSLKNLALRDNVCVHEDFTGFNDGTLSKSQELELEICFENHDELY